MPYSQAQLVAMSYNPVAMRGYFWSVAMQARKRALVTKREVVERGTASPVTHFDGIYEQDRRNRSWANVDENLSRTVLENLDALVRSCLERPKVCAACATNSPEKR